MATTAADGFETFVQGLRPRLLRAFAGCRGRDGAPDAAAEALAYAWEHWDEVRSRDNPVGWLYRVAQSRTRRRKVPVLPAPEELGLPDVEPMLIHALRDLPEQQRNRGPAGYDRTHNLQMYGVYDLPFGKGQRLAREGWASWVFGGFQVSGVVSVMSGLPFYVIQGSAPNLLAGGSGQVPNQLNPTIAQFGGIGTAAQRGASGGPWFDNTVLGVNCTANCAWAPATGAAFGSVGRNSLRGPGFFEADLSIFRTFTVSEDVKLQFRAEALNATNHANFANPQSDINNATFGFVTSTYGPNQSRQWRFGLRLSF